MLIKLWYLPKIVSGTNERNLEKRTRERFPSFVNKMSASNYDKHLIKENRSLDLHIEKMFLTLTLIESLEINNFKYCNILLNDQ